MSSHRPTSRRRHHETVYTPRHLIVAGAPLAGRTGSTVRDSIQTDTYDPPTEQRDGSFADVVERLFREFEDQCQLTDILRTVQQCRRQLDVATEPSLPELLERLARQRLSTGLAPPAS